MEEQYKTEKEREGTIPTKRERVLPSFSLSELVELHQSCRGRWRMVEGIVKVKEVIELLRQEEEGK